MNLTQHARMYLKVFAKNGTPPLSLSEKENILFTKILEEREAWLHIYQLTNDESSLNPSLDLVCTAIVKAKREG
jgi:hypothetical protein